MSDDNGWTIVIKKNKNIKSRKQKYELTKEIIVEKLKYLSKYDLKTVLLFGSYAKGLQKESSDIDVLIIWNKKVPDYTDKIKRELLELFERKVDLISMEYKNKPIFVDDVNVYDNMLYFLDNVLSEAIPIYGLVDDIKFSSYVCKN